MSILFSVPRFPLLCPLFLSRLLAFSFLSLLFACGDNKKLENTQAAPPLYRSAPVLAGTTATFSGTRSAYAIVTTNNITTVTDLLGSGGSVNLDPNVQLIIFQDISINLSIPKESTEIASQDLTSLIELYIAYFNRVPDAEGLSYWIGRFKAGMTLDQIGESFYAAGLLYSAQTGYTANTSNAEFVTIIYRNVLGRTTPDKEGLDYWTNSLSTGAATRGTLVRTILSSAHTYKGDATYGWVAQLLDNKHEVAKEFSVTQGISYILPTDSITKGVAIAATVTPSDTSVAKGLISILIGSKPASTDLPNTTQAARFLGQATFGTTKADINVASTAGLSSWIDAQFTAPLSPHKTYMDQTAAGLTNGVSSLSQNNFLESFWQQAINGNDQLRQRVSFSLSQIMVISFQDGGVANYPRGVASYYDTLSANA